MSTATEAAVRPTAAEDRSFFGHPRGLSTLFFTEMWERFSFYGIRPLLILFMTAAITSGGFGFERTQASAIYDILREGDEVRFRHAIPYPAHAQNAVRAALEVVRRAATAEEYEIAALRPQ